MTDTIECLLYTKYCVYTCHREKWKKTCGIQSQTLFPNGHWFTNQQGERTRNWSPQGSELRSAS